MPGGGVLTVASCEVTEKLRADCTCVRESGGSCEDEDPWVDAFWIGPDEVPRPVAFAPNGAACPTPTRPLLAPGSDGAPWLVAGRSDGTACLWRFEAWPEEAVAPSDDPASRPRFVATARTLAPAPDGHSPLLSLAPDAFVWTTEQGEGGLFGVVLGHRGPLTRDDFELLDDSPYRPAHLVPDRVPEAVGGMEPLVAYARTPSVDAPGAPPHPTLTLRPAEPPITLWVTDTLYDDVSVSLKVELASDTAAVVSPVLVFAGNESDAVGTCSWTLPEGAESASLTATRDGALVTLSAPDVADATCTVSTGRVALGVRAGTEMTRLSSLRVERR
jgi:hypothetical protein